MHPNSSLTQQQMARKVILLLLLSAICQFSEVWELRISRMQNTRTGVRFHIDKPTKTYNFNNLEQTGLQLLDINALPSCPEICPVQNLLQYLKMTNNMRRGVDHVFILCGPRIGRAASATCRRWVKDHMRSAGLGTYQVHSCRSSASTECPLLSLGINKIVRMIGWSTPSTFFNSYMKTRDYKERSSTESESSTIFSEIWKTNQPRFVHPPSYAPATRFLKNNKNIGRYAYVHSKAENTLRRARSTVSRKQMLGQKSAAPCVSGCVSPTPSMLELIDQVIDEDGETNREETLTPFLKEALPVLEINSDDLPHTTTFSPIKDSMNKSSPTPRYSKQLPEDGPLGNFVKNRPGSKELSRKKDIHNIQTSIKCHRQREIRPRPVEVPVEFMPNREMISLLTAKHTVIKDPRGTAKSIEILPEENSIVNTVLSAVPAHLLKKTYMIHQSDEDRPSQTESTHQTMATASHQGRTILPSTCIHKT